MDRPLHFDGFVHGGDYNPEQWMDRPEIFKRDLQAFKDAHINCVTLAMFSWVSFEPEEGVFTFEWFDAILEELHKNNISVVLSTPSGARPPWLSKKYPEVMRVNEDRVRVLPGYRHNSCFTSKKYREKVKIIDTEIAKRYANHPAVILFHLSNEPAGMCYCDECTAAFREWLKNKYKTLDNLNKAWWTRFWSARYSDWDQIDAPSPNGAINLHNLRIDYNRFTTDQLIDFLNSELQVLRAYNDSVPATVNFLPYAEDYDCYKFRDLVDIISYDPYPKWHSANDVDLAVRTAFYHNQMRSIKGKPWVLMESTPSTSNWCDASKLKKPGVHVLSSLQCVAHGADTVQYFQLRKSRGGFEKFHGAVLDHYGDTNTRVFQEVKELGALLEKIKDVRGTGTVSEVAFIYDWENRWAVNESSGIRNCGIMHEETQVAHYRAFWEQGINVDVVNMDYDLGPYKLIIAPTLYLLKPGFADRLKAAVANGATVVMTCWSAIVDENDLCFDTGFPGDMMDLFGVWNEETDALLDDQRNAVRMLAGNSLQLAGEYGCKEICALLHAQTAEVLAEYAGDFYAGTPAVTCNAYGKGKAYYLATRFEKDFYRDFYAALIGALRLKRNLPCTLPAGVTATTRTGKQEYIFLQNYNDVPAEIVLPATYKDVASGEMVANKILLPKYSVRVLSPANT